MARRHPPGQYAVLQHYRHSVIARMRYADFEYDGSRPFSSIGEPLESLLIEFPIEP